MKGGTGGKGRKGGKKGKRGQPVVPPKDDRTVRVPNPDAPLRGRLKTPSHKVHRSKKGYQRRSKHPSARDE
jgi:hypothetical protein